MSLGAELEPHACRELGTTGERHEFVVCSGESCRKAGSFSLLGALRNALLGDGPERVELHLSASRCLGHCNLAPAVVEDGRVLGWVSLSRLQLELQRLGLISRAENKR